MTVFTTVPYKRQKVSKNASRRLGARKWTASSSSVSFKIKNGFAVSLTDIPARYGFDEGDYDFFSRTGYNALWVEKFTSHTISPNAQNDYEAVLRLVGLSQTISKAFEGSVFEKF